MCVADVRRADVRHHEPAVWRAGRVVPSGRESGAIAADDSRVDRQLECPAVVARVILLWGYNAHSRSILCYVGLSCRLE